jgi:hypothetical protein
MKLFIALFEIVACLLLLGMLGRVIYGLFSGR